MDIPAELKRNWEQEDRTWFAQTTRYFCLPDTVDPRGPKGSTR